MERDKLKTLRGVQKQKANNTKTSSAEGAFRVGPRLGGPHCEGENACQFFFVAFTLGEADTCATVKRQRATKRVRDLRTWW